MIALFDREQIFVGCKLRNSSAVVFESGLQEAMVHQPYCQMSRYSNDQERVVTAALAIVRKCMLTV